MLIVICLRMKGYISVLSISDYMLFLGLIICIGHIWTKTAGIFFKISAFAFHKRSHKFGVWKDMVSMMSRLTLSQCLSENR